MYELESMNYLIKYEVHSTIGGVLKKGTMKVKNKESSIQAQVHLERYFKIKLKYFGRLIVHSCKQENSFSEMFNAVDKGFKFPWQ